MTSMPGMNSVTHSVLGAPIIVSSRTSLFHVGMDFPAIPDCQRRKCATSRECDQNASMLLPQDAAFFAVVVDAVGGLYIRPQSDEDTIYCMKPEFALLARLIPADSSCLVIVYHCGAGTLNMGLYDLMRLGGVGLKDKPLLELHSMLHETFHFNLRKHEQHQAAHGHQCADLRNTLNIRVHWVGWQEACIRLFEDDSELPFKPACIYRLDEAEYVHMLTPIRTRWS
jgi:hypothetical protein